MVRKGQNLPAVHPYLMPFTFNRELMPPPSLNVEDRRSTAQTIQNLLTDPRTPSWLMPDWRTPFVPNMQRSPGDTTTTDEIAERHFDPYLLQPDLNQMPVRVRVGDPNARQIELPGSVPADVPVPRVSTGRWGDQASLQGGETLSMGPNEEPVSSANYVAPVSGRWIDNNSNLFGAPRGVRGRNHAGNDLRAENGSSVVASIGGTVLYAGDNKGYGPNVVILGDDGNAFRYATHRTISVKQGDRVEQGQPVGTIGSRHLHFEVIPAGSPTLEQMKANPGEFISTQWWGRGDPVTIDPASLFGVERGTQIVAGQPAGSVTASSVVPDGIASLTAPSGGTEVSSPPNPLSGFATSIENAGFGSPGQQAITEMLRPPTQLPPQWDPATGFPEQPRRPGPGGALGVDLGQQPAGMPVPPSRPGTFDWLGGGAPDAGLVPPPGISPLRPAMGGPGDRRPQPPIPQARPWQGPMPQGRPGNFDWLGGGAPGAPPDPRMRPSAPQSPVEAFSPPAGPLDLIPYSTQPRATPAPAIPGPSEMQRLMTRGQLGGTPPVVVTPEEEFARASRITPVMLGGNDFTQMSLDKSAAGTPFPQPTPAPPAPSPAPPSPYDDPSRAFDVPPPLSAMADRALPVRQPAQDFDFTAGPGPTFSPSPPEARMKDDVFSPSSVVPISSYTELPSISGGAGADALNPLSSPTPPVSDPWARAYGTQMAIPANWGDPSSVPISQRLDAAAPPTPKPGVTPGASLPMKITSPVQDADVATQPTAGTGTATTNADEASATEKRPASGFLPTVAQIAAGAVFGPVGSLIAGAVLGRGGNRWDEGPRGSLGPVGRFLTSPLAPIIGGRNGGGFIGPNGFFSNAGSFTPSGAGGTSFFNQQPGGAMGTTNWRHGSVTGNPNMQGTMWNRSGDNGSVGYVTDPFNPGTSMIYSGSPNRF